MALTTFTSGQVLTAAQLNAVQANDYNQTVSTKTASYTLVAADKGTRVVMNVASANTVTVNTSLFSAGDTLVIQNIGAGVTTVTAGTATVSSAGPLAIPQYGGGTLYFTSAGVSIFFPSAGPAATSALTLITTHTFNAASTVISGVFSATYNNYLIKGSQLDTSASNPNLRLRLGSGTQHAFTEIYFSGSSTGAVATSATTGNFFNVGQLDSGAGDENNLTIDLRSPFLANKTGLMAFHAGNSSQVRATYGVEISTTSFTDMTFSTEGGQTLTGSLQVYGYSLS